MQPSSYTYRSDALVNSAVDDDCEEEEDNDGTAYTTCTSPNLLLTDTLLGPTQFNESDSSTYYLWNKDRSNPILFTFPTAVSITGVQLYFYTDSDSGIALPKIRLSLVNETVTAADIPDDVTTPSFTIIGEVGSNSLNNISLSLPKIFQAITTQVLLRIEEDKVYALALSEIKFCSG